MGEHGFPRLSSIADLASHVEAHPSKARACWVLTPDGQCIIEYPVLGPPPPHQPRVCRFRDEKGRVCGIGGHIARTHNATTSLSTRALTHAVWMICNMDNLGIHHAVRHIQVLLDILCGLEGRRRHYLVDSTADIQSILVMYDAVLQWFGKTNTNKNIPQNTKRTQRSSIAIVNDLLLHFSKNSFYIEDHVVADVASPKLVTFLFPASHLQTNMLQRLCQDAFTSQDISRLQKMAKGHFGDCLGENCTCHGEFVKVPRINVDVVCCHRCGLPGHNKATCQERTTATHVAVALATLLDPHKNPRISAKTAHLTLFNCYDVIVTLLYKWFHKGTPWHITGNARIRSIKNFHPEILLRLYNHTLATLKKCPKVGPTMLVVSRPDRLMVEAAHCYDEKSKDSVKQETEVLKNTVQALIEETQDEDLERPRWADPQSFVSAMVQSSTQQDPRIAQDLARFAFDDVFF